MADGVNFFAGGEFVRKSDGSIQGNAILTGAYSHGNTQASGTAYLDQKGLKSVRFGVGYSDGSPIGAHQIPGQGPMQQTGATSPVGKGQNFPQQVEQARYMRSDLEPPVIPIRQINLVI